MFQMRYQVRSSEVGEDLLMQTNQIIDALQDCEGFHIHQLEQFNTYLNTHEIGIFLNFRQVDILRRPQFTEWLRFETFPYDTRGFLGYRNTVVYDEKNQPVIITNVLGAFTQIKTLRPARLPQTIIDSLDAQVKYPMDYTSRKIDIPEHQGERKEEIRIQRSHIDRYHHLNNMFSVEFADNVLPKDYVYNRIRGEYKHPVVLGDVLVPTVWILKDRAVVTLENQAHILCTVIEFSSFEEKTYEHLVK